ncbi:SRPBCC family protein [soil metagenome]
MAADLVATASITIQAPADRVWHALTDPATITTYYFGTTVTTDWRRGSPITWEGEHEGTPYRDHGTVLDVVPNRLLRNTHFSPLSGRQDVPENYHTLTYTLEESDGSTTVTFTQDNNDTYDEVEHSEKNWSVMLNGLKRAVEG